MGYTDYMGLPDDLFFNEVFKLYESIDKDKLQFLVDSPFIMERFKKLFSGNFIIGDIRRSARNFVKLYDSYVILSSINSVINNPLDYSDDDRERIFNSYISFVGDLRGLRFFSKEESAKIKNIISAYKGSQTIDEESTAVKNYRVKYDAIIASLKRIIEVYSKYGESDKLYSIMYDDMKIKLSSFNSIVKYTKALFCQNLCSDSNMIGKNLLTEFSLNDIYLLEKINSSYSKIFCKYDFKNVKIYDSSDYEKLFKLFDQISTSMSRRKALEYTVGYLSNDLQISLNDLDSYYYSIFKSFCNYKLTGFECDDTLKVLLDNRKFKYSDISNLTNVMTIYRKMFMHSCYLIDLICSDNKNLNGLINLIYGVKFFNKVTPSMNQVCLSSRIRFLNEVDQEKCNKFIAGYKAYYNTKKEFLADQKRQEITDNEVNNMDTYVTNVQLFLDSGCRSIDEYFGNNADDKEAFEFSLRVLNKHNHPIYQRYSEFIDSIKAEEYNLLLGKCLEIVNFINNGVTLPNGEVREFDLVDYYKRTNLSKPRFNDIVGDTISHDDFVNVSRFFAKYKGDRVIEGGDIDKLYTTKMSFPCKWDENGNVIAYYEATKEDIMDVIISIGDMGIPLTGMTFGIVLRNKVMKNISEKNLTNYEKCV
jgi:hypothetical protein